jgi:hypothetical protein
MSLHHPYQSIVLIIERFGEGTPRKTLQKMQRAETYTIGGHQAMSQRCGDDKD